MSRAYSNHFDATGVAAIGGTTTFNTEQPMLSPNIGHGRVRCKVAHAEVGTAGMTSGDELRLCRFKAHDHILSIKIGTTGASTTYAADLGLYQAGDAGDGAVIDADLFASALALATSIDLVDQLAESSVAATVGSLHGKALWELAAQTEPAPGTQYDLVLTSTATGTTVAEEITCIVLYTAGD